MNGPSLRQRVLAAFVLLIALGLLESGLVLYLQREEERSNAQAQQAERIRHETDELNRTLEAMQAAQRGYLLTHAGSELERYQRHVHEYQRLASGIPRLLPPERHAEFERVRQSIDDWRINASDVLISRALRADSVTPQVAMLGLPRFARAHDALSAFVARQVALADEASQAARVRTRRAMTVLTLAPLAGTIVTVILLFTANRGILRAQAVAAAHAETVGARDELLAIINTVPAALIILNRDGSLGLSNRAAEQMLGTPPPGPSAADYWRSFDYHDTSGRRLTLEELPAMRAFSGEEVPGEELQMHRPGHRPITILVSAAPLRDADGAIRSVASGFLDITRLRELDRMKEDFVSVVTHELRTPLTAIRGSLQLLLADAATVPDPENRQLVDVALKSCERLVRIINDVLDVSRIKAGRLNLKRRALPVADAVQQSIDVVNQLAADAHLRFDVQVPPTIPAVMADPDRLTQAIVNLLSNAVKFAPARSTVRITAHEEDGLVAIAVRDSGPGIAPEDLSRLFEKFQQLDRPATRRAGGTGLGLAITKGIVEEHGGRVTVESVVGQGATFTLWMPRA